MPRFFATFLLTMTLAAPGFAETFFSDIPEEAERIWTGPETFANRLLDWRIANGRLECIEGRQEKPHRTLHLFDRQMADREGSFKMRVRTGPINPDPKATEDTWAGFLIGVGGAHVDYRTSSLSHHWPGHDGGVIVAMDGTGRIVFRDNAHDRGPRRPTTIETRAWPEVGPKSEATGAWSDRIIELSGTNTDDGGTLTVTVFDAASNKQLDKITLNDVDATLLDGNVALVSHVSPKGNGSGYWFNDWTVEGDLFDVHPERGYGPIVATQYTLSEGTLKLVAQMAPIGTGDTRNVRLEMEEDGTWNEVAQAEIQPYSFTALLRVENYAADADRSFRVRYDIDGDGVQPEAVYSGIIRRDPVNKDKVVVAAFTGHHISAQGQGHWNGDHFWYPHTELVDAVAYHDPDLLFFSGDQIYEGGLEGIVRDPVDEATVDYLYHWYRWCLAFRDLTRDRPSITIPDDHDVYHGNIWGAGGKAAQKTGNGKQQQDSGGYTMDPIFVNAVHRTQVSHLPDPVDPAPILQDITVYHTNMEYGGLSFAIIADRMFKSSPTVLVPDGGVVNGWFEAPGFDIVKDSDVPGAILLGDRQLNFLENWVENWSEQATMKVLLSQTIFANIATLPEDAINDTVVPGMKQPSYNGEYMRGDKFVGDGDSNGWPKSGRDRALRVIRKGYAFHIAGDQHLGSFSQYGIDDWNDAGFALCVPSIANVWPRRWFPPEPGANRKPDSPEYTGDFHDGFGNKITVHAVSNPNPAGHEPAALHDRAPGYGIVRFNKKERTITSEVWPRWVNPRDGETDQYPGWPITVSQFDNYAARSEWHLPEIAVTGATDPILQARDATDGLVFSVRMKGDKITARVPEEGSFTVSVIDQASGQTQILADVKSLTAKGETITVEF